MVRWRKTRSFKTLGVPSPPNSSNQCAIHFAIAYVFHIKTAGFGGFSSFFFISNLTHPPPRGEYSGGSSSVSQWTTVCDVTNCFYLLLSSVLLLGRHEDAPRIQYLFLALYLPFSSLGRCPKYPILIAPLREPAIATKLMSYALPAWPSPAIKKNI